MVLSEIQIVLLYRVVLEKDTSKKCVSKLLSARKYQVLRRV